MSLVSGTILLLRGIDIGVAILIAAAFWRACPRSMLAWVGVLFATGLIAYQLWTGNYFPVSWRLARLVLGLAVVSTPFFFWALVRFIFEDEFALRAIHWLMLVLLEIMAISYAMAISTNSPGGKIVFGVALRLSLIAIVAHVLHRVWVARAVDLVEERMRLRRLFVITVGGAVLYELTLALIYAPASQRPIGWQLSEVAMLLLANLFLASRLLVLNHYFLTNSAPNLPVSDSFRVSMSLSNQPSLHKPNVEGDALDRLDALMTKEYVWRETGLSIGSLADRMRIPEYRLRKLINEQLGYRNFTAFLNEYRLAAAAKRLADRSQVRTPILTIALDLGWASIGPFNRAFRAKFNMTPSDYRQRGVPTAERAESFPTSPNS